MHAADTYDYAVIRVVPRVEREEFINVGVILSCERAGFLQARIEVDEARLRAIDPGADLELVGRHLAAIAAVCESYLNLKAERGISIYEALADLANPGVRNA